MTVYRTRLFKAAGSSDTARHKNISAGLGRHLVAIVRHYIVL